MASESDIRQTLIAQRVVPVLRLPSAALTERAVDCLAEAGFTTMEITMTTPDALGLVRRISGKMLVGAGTVLDLDTAKRCLDAGAQFLVAPCLIPGLARTAHDRGAAALVGGFTPGEILAAHREGADIVKLFPASTGGPEHLRAIHAVFPDIRLCPTGGVSLDNMKAYFAAGDRAAVIAHAKRFLA